MKTMQEDMIEDILSSYTLTDVETLVLYDYIRVIYISFSPNVMIWIYLIDKYGMSDKVIEF